MPIVTANLVSSNPIGPTSMVSNVHYGELTQANEQYPGGNWDLLHWQANTSSGAANVTFKVGTKETIMDDTYTNYVVKWIEATPETNNVFLLVRTSSDGGENWDEGASDYSYINFRYAINDTTVFTNGDDLNSFANTGIQRGDFGGATYGTMTIVKPWDTNHTIMHLEAYSKASSTGADTFLIRSDMRRLSTTPVESILLYWGTGDWDRFQFWLFGVK